MKKVIKGISFTLLTVGIIFILSKLFQIKPVTYGMKEFYLQDKNEIQVIGFGTSHIVHCLSPMRMYDNYGITSFVCGAPNQMIETAYYVLDDVYKRQKPEVIILDTGNFFYSDGSRIAKNRAVLEQMILSENKFMLSHALACYTNDEYKNTISYLFPFVTYHSRWKELTRDDLFLFEYNGMTKGQTIGNQIYTKEIYKNTFLPDDTSDIEAQTITDRNKEYIVKFKELCDKNGSRLIFISTPSKKWDYSKEKAIVELSEELGIEYINLFLEDGSILEYDRDMNDENHVNTRGAEKVTDYLAKYLIENCEVESNGKVNDFDEAEGYYEKYMEISNIQLETDVNAYIDNYLSNTGRFDYAICVQRDEYELFSPELKNRLNSFGIDGSFDEGNVYAAFYEEGDLKYSEWLNYQTEVSYKSKKYGQIDFLSNDDMPKTYHADDKVLSTEGGLNILLFDRKSSVKIDFVRFSVREGQNTFERLSHKQSKRDEQMIDYRHWLLKNY